MQNRNIFRRVLSALLVLCTVLSLLPVSVLAEDAPATAVEEELSPAALSELAEPVEHSFFALYDSVAGQPIPDGDYLILNETDGVWRALDLSDISVGLPGAPPVTVENGIVRDANAAMSIEIRSLETEGRYSLRADQGYIGHYWIDSIDCFESLETSRFSYRIVTAAESLPNVAIYTLENEMYPLAIHFTDNAFLWKDYFNNVNANYLSKELTDETDIRNLRLAAHRTVELESLYEAINGALVYAEAQGLAPALYADYVQLVNSAVEFYGAHNDVQTLATADPMAVNESIAGYVKSLNAFTLVLGAMSGAADVSEQLAAALTALEEPVPANAFIDIAKEGTTNLTGDIFIVNEIKDKNGESVFYALDPITPSYYGKMTAKRVELKGDLAAGTAALTGLHPEMALTFEKRADISASAYRARVHGEYDSLSAATYVNCAVGTVYGGGYAMDLTAGVDADKNSAFGVQLRPWGKVSLTYTSSKDNTTALYYHYPALNVNTAPDPDDTTAKVYFEINTNTSGTTTGSSSYVAYPTYYAGREDMVSSYLFRRLENRVYTEQLKDALLSYADLLDNDARYERANYQHFLAAMQEMISAYIAYNGVSVQDKAARDAAEAEILEMQENMISVAGMLRINRQTEAGTKINTFKASIYRWDEAEYNALTAAKDTGSTKKGFYFTATNIPGIASANVPIWSKWESGNAYSEWMPISGTTNGREAVLAHRYAIVSGLASADIAGLSSPMNTSKVITGINLWEKTPLVSNGKNVREVYNNVSVPFVYDVETGYYTLDSDANAVYFDGEPEDNASLKIADKPISFSRITSVPIGNGINDADERTYGLYSEYITGIQPFAEISTRSWKGYYSYARSGNAGEDKLVDTYLSHGVATDKRYVTDYGDLGAQQWGIGMQLEVPFRITEDGMLDGEPIIFEFSGDDDVWVYIDNELVLDIGGVHDAIQGKIDFTTGTVYVSSRTYDYIRDTTGTYGKDTSLYNLSTPIQVQSSTGNVDYGKSLSHMSVVSMKDGSTPVRMYQENIYTGSVNGTAATAAQVKAFSEAGAHTLKIFYMDRGKGKTNCKISFNLPTTDTVVVEKDFEDCYYNVQTGGATSVAIDEDKMQELLNQSYSFTAYCNDVPMANTVYSIIENNMEIGMGTTDAAGNFTILGKQQAEFRSAEFSGGNVYRVVEGALNAEWLAPTYSYSYSGAGSIDAAEGEGNSYAPEGDPDAAETLRIVCKNYYTCAADPINVVIDYAKPVEVEVRSRAIASGVAIHKFATATMTAQFANPDDAVYGSFELFASEEGGQIDSLRFYPKEILSGIITVNCIFTTVVETGYPSRKVAIPVRIIPATSVYYETDFSADAFRQTTFKEGVKLDEWETKGEVQDDTQTEPALELQDSGTTQSVIEEFVFDRGGEIPSNAFFADFNNDTARYAKHITYRDTSQKNSYINYDEASDGTHATKWSYNANRTTQPNLWWKAGYMRFSMVNDTESAYVQTGPNLGSGYKLNYHPEADHFLQVRFKMTNVVGTGTDGVGYMHMYYYIGSNSTEDVNDGKERAYCPGYVEIPAEAFTSGEYITLSIPLKDINPEHTKITALRVTFNNIKSKEGAEGGFHIDYIYCGPSTSRSGSKGLAHETNYMPYLYFNFSNNAADTVRYTNDASYGGIKDYDTNLNRWVVATSLNKTTEEHTNFVPSGFSGGVASFQVGPRTNSDGQYGSYIAPTKNTNNFPWQNDSSDFCLNFYPNKSLTYYAVVRFKLTGMKQVSGEQAKVQFTLIDSSNNIKHPAKDYTFANGTWHTVAVPISSSLNNLGSCIKSFYIRMANIRPSSDTAYGKVEIDFIYVGTGQNYDNAYHYDANEKQLFVDFRNTTYDQARYNSRAYGHTNMDIKSGWNNDWWFTYAFNNAKGTVKLTPTADYHGSNWGQIEANNSDRKAIMRYHLTGNDYAVVRMRHSGLTSTGEFKFIFGTGNQTGLVGDKDSSGNVLPIYEVSKQMNKNNDGQWVTYVFDLSSYKGKLDADKITFFRLVWSAKMATTGYYEIDYIYVGPLHEADPPEDTLYFGFENTAEDKARYNTKSYNYTNYDTPGATKLKYINSDSAIVDNAAGTLTLTADTEDHSTFGFGPNYDISFHPKSKTAQARFKLEDFVLRDETKGPQFYVQYNIGGNWTVAALTEFDTAYLTNGRYITIMLDLNATVAEELNNTNAVSMLRFVVGNLTNAEGKQGKVVFDYVYLGPKDEKLEFYEETPTYGYDSTYANDLEYSNGTSLFVEGAGMPAYNGDYTVNYEKSAEYTESCFTFTGTGFDIISRTGPEQGSVRAVVYDESGAFVDATQVICKSESELDLYQIPVISMRLEQHGTYTVKLFVAEAYDYGDDGKEDIFGGALDRGGEFYFDALRVYDTINTKADTLDARAAYEVYLRHGEADAQVQEVRTLLLDEKNYAFNTGSAVDGVLFLDNTGLTSTVGNYISAGPNNEVYLTAGNAVSFVLSAPVIPASVDIGAKSADKETANMRIVAANTPTSEAEDAQTISIGTGTAQNYAIRIDAADWSEVDGKYQTYITISNVDSDGVLSLTNLKYAYDIVTQPRQRAVRLLVDDRLNHFMECDCGYSYEELPDGTHRAVCGCGMEFVEDHRFQGGLCVCGAGEFQQDSGPVLNSELTFGEVLALESDLTMHFRVKESKLEGYDLSTAYLVVERDVYATGAAQPTVETVTLTDFARVDGRLSFSYSGISAAQMNDSIRATLHIKDASGRAYYSPVKTTSVATYLDGLLQNSASDSKLTTLIMDLVNYGTAAQVYFDRHADAPVNEAYESFKTYGDFASSELASALEDLSSRTENGEFSSAITTTLDLGTRVGITYKVTLPEDVDWENAVLVIRDSEGKTLQSIALSEGTVDSKGRCVVNFYGNSGRDMRRTVYATLTVEGRTASDTFGYSISTYAWSVQENAAAVDSKLLALTEMMMRYGDSAAAYFA